MKKGMLILISMSALGLYICKFHPEVKAKMMKPFKRMITKINI